jgi:membrane-associated phospholipid phosphatase
MQAYVSTTSQIRLTDLAKCSLALALLFLVLAGPLAAQETVPALSSADVNALDQVLMFSYSEPLDTVSDYTQYVAFLAPAVFAFAAPVRDWLGIGAMYAGSAALSYAARVGLKAVVERNRPYMYFSNPPASLIEEGDHLDSFPSGHSIMAFTGAGYTATLFALRYPDSPYRVAAAGAYALTAATVTLRIGSGSHFLTDVVAGAAIGTLFGFIVPYVSDRLGWLD